TPFAGRIDAAARPFAPVDLVEPPDVLTGFPPPPPPPPHAAAPTASSAAPARVMRRERIAGSLLTARTAPHQRGREVAEVAALQHAADALRDRQLDPEPPREVAEHRCRRETLDHGADLGSGVGGRAALRDQLACPAVAAV